VRGHLKVVEAADLMDIKTQNVNTAVTKLPFGREEWTSTFNVTKGPLGIALTELHFPRKKRIKGLLNVFNRETEYAPVVIGSVDPLGQGVKQDRRIRPGLVAKAVQGRLLTGMRAKDVIKVLEGEILARSDTEAMQEAGLSDLIAITFSSECVALPSEPDYCFNSVMDKDSVVGLTDDDGNTPPEAIDFLRTVGLENHPTCPRTSWQEWAACDAMQQKLQWPNQVQSLVNPESAGVMMASPEQ